MVSGGMTLVKYLLFIFNLLFVISGLAILVIGVMAMYPYKHYSTFMDPKYGAGPILLIAVGSIIFVIAFFGCCGAIRENNCMIVTYSVLLLTIFCIQLAAGICGYVYRNDAKKSAEIEFRNSMEKYNSDPTIKEAWDNLQADLKCCGMNGPGDWRKYTMDTPQSCCGPSEGDKTCKMAHAFAQGCYDVLKEEIEHYALIIGGVAIGIAFVQLLGVILACCLARSIRKEYETV